MRASGSSSSLFCSFFNDWSGVSLELSTASEIVEGDSSDRNKLEDIIKHEVEQSKAEPKEDVLVEDLDEESHRVTKVATLL